MLRYPNCARWHGSRSYTWLDAPYVVFMRGGTGVFSFSYNDWGDAGLCGRGVAVVQ